MRESNTFVVSAANAVPQITVDVLHLLRGLQLPGCKSERLRVVFTPVWTTRRLSVCISWGLKSCLFHLLVSLCRFVEELGNQARHNSAAIYLPARCFLLDCSRLSLFVAVDGLYIERIMTFGVASRCHRTRSRFLALASRHFCTNSFRLINYAKSICRREISPQLATAYATIRPG